MASSCISSRLLLRTILSRSGISRLASSSSSSSSSSAAPPPPSKALMETIVCPLTKEPLVYDAEHHALLSESVGVRYPISHETGIPNLIPREATLVQAEGAGDRKAEK